MIRYIHPGLGRPRIGFGDIGLVAQPLADAAVALLDAYTASGCNMAAGVVSTFQTQYNGAHSTPISVDGKYGPQTQGALDQVISDSQQIGANETLPNALTGLSAPATCFGAGGGGSSTPAAPPPVAPPPAAPPPPPAHASMFSPSNLLLGLALTAAAAVAYEVHKKHGGKSLGQHARRLSSGARRAFRM